MPGRQGEGRLTIVVEGTGKKNVSLIAFASPMFQDDFEALVGMKVPVEMLSAENLPPETEERDLVVLLRNAIRARVSHETRIEAQKAEEASASNGNGGVATPETDDPEPSSEAAPEEDASPDPEDGDDVSTKDAAEGDEEEDSPKKDC